MKEIVKSDLGRRYAKIPLRGVRYLAIDEFPSRAQGPFHDRGALDLESGQILWMAKGRGSEALRKFFRRLRLARARGEGGRLRHGGGLLERGREIPAESRGGV